MKLEKIINQDTAIDLDTLKSDKELLKQIQTKLSELGLYPKSRIDGIFGQETEAAIAQFCQQWQIREFYVFGSVLREDFRPDSDIDVMVSFQANAPWGLLELVRMKRELETIVGREVDLVTKQSIEQSENWIRRQEILSTARVIYAKQ